MTSAGPHAHVPEADSVQIEILHRSGQRPEGDALPVAIDEFEGELSALFRDTAPPEAQAAPTLDEPDTAIA